MAKTTAADKKARDQMLQSMADAMIKRNVNPTGLAALAAVTAFMGALTVIVALTNAFSAWSGRLALVGLAILGLSEKARAALLTLFGGVL